MSKLFIECDQKDKADWVQAARASGIGNGKLEAWVIETLNQAAAQVDIPAPSWMPFSKPLCQALRVQRITKPDELVTAIESAGIDSLQWLDAQYKDEIENWYWNK